MSKNKASKSFVKILTIGIFLLYGLFWAQKINLITADLGRHLKNGEIILQNLSIPKTNLYSYTHPDHPFLNHHWASGVVFFLIHQAIGFHGLSILFILLSLLTLYFFFDIAQKSSNLEIATFVSIVALPVITNRVEIRPELFSYLLSGLFFWILFNYKNGRFLKRSLWFLPILTILWVNLHIYFFVGLLLVGLFFLEAFIFYLHESCKSPHLSWRAPPKAGRGNLIELGLILTLCATAALINPAGLTGALYPFKIFTNYGYRLLENQSVWFLERIVSYPPALYFKIAFGFLLLSWIYVLIQKRSHFSTVYSLLSTILSLMAWFAVRNFTLFGFFALTITASNLNGLINKRTPLFAMAVLIGLYFINPPLFKSRLKPGLGLEEPTAQAAKFFLKENIAGPILNNYDIGSFLIYYLYPKHQVFVDNRPEAYPKEFFEKVYIPLQEKEGSWLEQERLYSFNAIFFYRHDLTPWAQSFLIARAFDPNWATIYADAYSIIFVKRNEKNLSLIKTYELPKEMFSIKKVR